MFEWVTRADTLDTGKSECPFIDSAMWKILGINGTNDHCLPVELDSSVECYPPGFGLGKCDTHSSNLPPTCDGSAGNVPQFCYRSGASLILIFVANLPLGTCPHLSGSLATITAVAITASRHAVLHRLINQWLM